MDWKFYEKQNQINQENYIKLLQKITSLSNLFSDSKVPYLHYRVMENIFCDIFSANNLSRNDISVDAEKNKIGIGLKTFLHSNGRTYQKIAEFNKESYLFQNLNSDKDIIYKVSELRNLRLNTTKKIVELDDLMYHVITRKENSMYIYEEHMDFIDLNNIRYNQSTKNTIKFTDGLNEYNFNLSKSTLFKRFNTFNMTEVDNLEVNILNNPFELLLNINENDLIKNNYSKNKIVDFIILPLYSPSLNEVPKKSGLNQWNASGRKRNLNEVYIPIPAWIHKKKNNFFNYSTLDNKTNSFDVILPNNKELTMRVAQDGGKALMSNPNSDLGKWILRDVLSLEPRALLTKNKLDSIGIDSIKLSKLENGKFTLNFLKSGSYTNYKDSFN